MPSLPISQLPTTNSGSPNSLMVIVSYDVNPSGITNSIPFSSLTSQFSGYYTTSGITTSSSLTWDHNYYGVSGSTGLTLTLPSTINKNGYSLIIKDESGNCSVNSITIIPSGGSLIDGQTQVIMNINFMSLTFIVRDNNWFLI